MQEAFLKSSEVVSFIHPIPMVTSDKCMLSRWSDNIGLHKVQCLYVNLSQTSLFMIFKLHRCKLVTALKHSEKSQDHWPNIK